MLYIQPVICRKLLILLILAELPEGSKSQYPIIRNEKVGCSIHLSGTK